MTTPDTLTATGTGVDHAAAWAVQCQFDEARFRHARPNEAKERILDQYRAQYPGRGVMFLSDALNPRPLKPAPKRIHCTARPGRTTKAKKGRRL